MLLIVLGENMSQQLDKECFQNTSTQCSVFKPHCCVAQRPGALLTQFERLAQLRGRSHDYFCRKGKAFKLSSAPLLIPGRNLLANGSPVASYKTIWLCDSLLSSIFNKASTHLTDTTGKEMKEITPRFNVRCFFFFFCDSELWTQLWSLCKHLAVFQATFMFLNLKNKVSFMSFPNEESQKFALISRKKKCALIFSS